MKNHSLPLLALLAGIAKNAYPLEHGDITAFSTPLLTNSGLKNPTLSLSAGGKAICVAGIVPVTTTAKNKNINVGDISNQTSMSNTVVEIVQVNTTYPARAVGGDATISGTFNINAKICFPLNQNDTKSKTIQFLTHGIGFDMAYWDFVEAYSYVDAAAEAGYTTFLYDRLGTGASDHPDPISVVQTSLQVAIAHSLIQSLRGGAFNNGQEYSRIIGVGHSFGSIITNAITANYATDLDAAVLTSFSTNTAAIGLTIFGFNPAIASENQPLRFPDLSSGYLVADTSISNQITFFRAPNFDPKVFGRADVLKQTFTLAELLTLKSGVAPATSFKGPVDVVNGENDFIFCQANCNLPTDQSALVLKILYPVASNGSQSIIIPGTGHGINLHYAAPQAYQQILSFVKSNGF